MESEETAEIAEMAQEIHFWRLLYKHTRLIAQSETLSNAIESLLASAQEIEPEIEKLRPLYCKDDM